MDLVDASRECSSPRRASGTAHARHCDVDQAARLADTVPVIEAVHDLAMPPGRGMLFNRALRTVHRQTTLAGLRGLLTLIEFG